MAETVSGEAATTAISEPAKEMAGSPLALGDTIEHDLGFATRAYD